MNCCWPDVVKVRLFLLLISHTGESHGQQRLAVEGRLQQHLNNLYAAERDIPTGKANNILSQWSCMKMGYTSFLIFLLLVVVPSPSSASRGQCL